MLVFSQLKRFVCSFLRNASLLNVGKTLLFFQNALQSLVEVYAKQVLIANSNKIGNHKVI